MVRTTQVNNIKIPIPDYAKYVADKLITAGFQVYLVGGSVRDYIRDPEILPHDYDFVTDATPDKSYAMFYQEPDVVVTTTGMEHGTIKVWVGDHEPIDVTTLGHYPSYINTTEKITTYTSSIYDDISRRDFTMNSLVYHVNEDHLLDPYDGISDIKNKYLNVLGNPEIRMMVDPFIVLRGYRFAITMNLTIDPYTYKIMNSTRIRELLPTISAWRRGNELKKILSNCNHYEYFTSYLEALPYIIQDDYSFSSDAPKIMRMIVSAQGDALKVIGFMLRYKSTWSDTKSILINELGYESDDIKVIEKYWRKYHE